ncbi:MAG: hypothetical protein AB9828_03985 [Sphaerochaetaceae bacterium]
MNPFEISYRTVRGQAMTHIFLGEAAGDPPKHLMMHKKEAGYIVQGDSVSEWYWDNLIDMDGSRYLTFKELRILPFDTLFTTGRTRALQTLRELAQAFQKVPAGFIHPTNGFIETWRIFFLESGGFLLLSPTLSEIISASVKDEDRFKGFGRWIKPGVEAPFALCHQFTQFLYTACTGFTPYERKQVRQDRWRPLPLESGFSSVDPSLAKWVDKTLDLSAKEQRATVSAAYSGESNLSWWLTQTQDFSWHVEEEPVNLEILIQQNPQVARFWNQQNRSAGKREFWRKNGALVTSIAFGAILLSVLVFNWIAKEFEPPYTRDMDAIGVLEAYYQAQNDLDAEKLSASLVRGLKSPADLEVTSLFVNSKVRQAYEGLQTIVPADDWVAGGRSAIPGYAMVYGVAEVSIEHLGDNRYRASYHYFSPYADDGSTTEDPTFADAGDKGSNGVPVTELAVVEEFLMTDAKGYWQIQEIKEITSEVVGIYRIESYETGTPDPVKIQDNLLK